MGGASPALCSAQLPKEAEVINPGCVGRLPSRTLIKCGLNGTANTWSCWPRWPPPSAPGVQSQRAALLTHLSGRRAGWNRHDVPGARARRAAALRGRVRGGPSLAPRKPTPLFHFKGFVPGSFAVPAARAPVALPGGVSVPRLRALGVAAAQQPGLELWVPRVWGFLSEFFCCCYCKKGLRFPRGACPTASRFAFLHPITGPSPNLPLLLFLCLAPHSHQHPLDNLLPWPKAPGWENDFFALGLLPKSRAAWTHSPGTHALCDPECPFIQATGWAPLVEMVTTFLSLIRFNA